MGTPQDVAKGLDLFKTLIFDNAVEAVIQEFEGPILAIPVVGEIADGAEHAFADAIYDKLGGFVVLSSVLFVNLEHRRAFDSASIGLKKIAIDKGLDSPEYKDEHEKEKQALKKLGQFSVAQPGITG